MCRIRPAIPVQASEVQSRMSEEEKRENAEDQPHIQVDEDWEFPIYIK